MTVDRLKALVANDFDAVNALITEKCQSDVELTASLSSHIMESGGKRLRPLLVLLASRACGYQGQTHIALAAMIEFVHTATLLHDDVVDDSTLRRGKKTANNIWGSKASILVGDYLLTQSLDFMLRAKSWPIVHLVADTMHQLSSGEIKQLSNRGNYDLSTADYFDIIRSKTALLFAASAGIGGLLAEVEPNIQTNIYQYGLHLGNAFQLIDDVLDYTADAETMGKNAGDDLSEGVITMPLLHAMQHGSPVQKTMIKQSLETGSQDMLPDILAAITSSQGIEATRELAAAEVDKALTHLKNLPDSIYKEALSDLALFTIKRDY